jgi:hypothetical protein
MKIFSFSAQQFESQQNLKFCLDKYSRFKYGDRSVAREFGYELGEKFLHSTVYHTLQQELDLSEIPIVISSAPYKFIPTASFALKDYFVHEFNRSHAIKFGKSIEDIKIFRQHSYHDDYGSMTKEDRDKAITSEDFYIDEHFIQNKILLFIDDIKITGSHQSRIETLLQSINFTGHVIFLYYAELIGTEPPQIENYLNLYAINDLRDINKIIRESEFLFNTRVVKFILHANPGDFKTFIGFQSIRFNETLLHYAIGNEYFKEPKYQTNLNTLLLHLNHLDIYKG